MAIAATSAPRGPMALKDWGQLLLLGAIWGGSFFFARIAVAEMHPLVLVLFRVAIAAIALQLYLALRGPSFRLALPHAGLFFLLALTNNVVPFSLIFAGQTAAWRRRRLGAQCDDAVLDADPRQRADIRRKTVLEQACRHRARHRRHGGDDRSRPACRARRPGLGEIRADRRFAVLCASR